MTATGICRWLLAAACAGFGAWLLTGVYEPPPVADDGYAEDFPVARPPLGPVLGGLGLIILAAALVARDLAVAAASPFAALVDAVFLPGGKDSKPSLNLALPVFYVREERWEEALERYREIIRYYPQEVEAWLGAMELLALRLDRGREARKLYRRARRRFSRDPALLARIEADWEMLSRRAGSR